MPSVLFVCLGNICRSPMAEALCRHLLNQKGQAEAWHIDSAGTAAYHLGHAPDRRTLEEAKRQGVPIAHAARQVCSEDFRRFDDIFAMDQENLANLQRHPGAARGSAQLALLGIHDPQRVLEVADPYYGEQEDFAAMYRHLHRALSAWLQSLTKRTHG